jgi:hypothetical protein
MALPARRRLWFCATCGVTFLSLSCRTKPCVSYPLSRPNVAFFVAACFRSCRRPQPALSRFARLRRMQMRSEKRKLLETYITGEMKRRTDECKWLSPKGPFWYGEGTDATPLAQAAYERMQSIGHRVAIRDCRPHRLRDTFAVRMLLKDISLEDVSRLRASRSRTYDAKWVALRKRRLELLLPSPADHQPATSAARYTFFWPSKHKTRRLSRFGAAGSRESLVLYGPRRRRRNDGVLHCRHATARWHDKYLK